REDLHQADGDAEQAGGHQPPAQRLGGPRACLAGQALGDEQDGQAGTDDGRGAQAQRQRQIAPGGRAQRRHQQQREGDRGGALQRHAPARRRAGPQDQRQAPAGKGQQLVVERGGGRLVVGQQRRQGDGGDQAERCNLGVNGGLGGHGRA